MQPSERIIELIEKAEKLGKWVGCNVDEKGKRRRKRRADSRKRTRKHRKNWNFFAEKSSKNHMVLRMRLDSKNWWLI